jgi:putative SOS response-associated peptidase YedK
MCRRVAQYKGAREYADAFSEWPFLNFIGNAPLGYYNVAPSTRAAILCREEEALCARLVKWGWRPYWWVSDDKDRIGAPVEEVASSPFFRKIRPHRAICPVDGWYEWIDEGNHCKQPYFIQRRDRQPCLCTAIGHFACDARQPSHHEGFVIITADSQGGMVDSHDPRPVVLSPDRARQWLEPETTDEHAEQVALQQGEPAAAFEWHRVSVEVGAAGKQGPHLIVSVD